MNTKKHWRVKEVPMGSRRKSYTIHDGDNEEVIAMCTRKRDAQLIVDRVVNYEELLDGLKLIMYKSGMRGSEELWGAIDYLLMKVKW